MPKPTLTWKSAELRGARFFGAERNPLSGSSSKHTRSDSLHKSLYIEQKYRKKSAVWALWDDSKWKAKNEEKTPVLVLHEKSRPGFLIVVHKNDMPQFVAEFLASRGFEIDPADLEQPNETNDDTMGDTQSSTSW